MFNFLTFMDTLYSRGERTDEMSDIERRMAENERRMAELDAQEARLAGTQRFDNPRQFQEPVPQQSYRESPPREYSRRGRSPVKQPEPYKRQSSQSQGRSSTQSSRKPARRSRSRSPRKESRRSPRREPTYNRQDFHEIFKKILT